MSKEKLMTFLSAKLEECKRVIKKRKRKNQIIEAICVSLMTWTISGSVVVSLLTSLTVPVIAVESIAAGVAIASALSLKFNLEHKNKKLAENIQNLEKIKDKLDYVTACNGDISEEECNFILNQFRIL